MDINFLTLADGVWTYQDKDQPLLLADCQTLLKWDLSRFDRWLFDSNNWSMYTRRRQSLIALRTGLVAAWRCNANSFATRDLLIADFCVQVWAKSRSQEFRDVPEIQEMRCAYRIAKTVRLRLLSKVQSQTVLQPKKPNPNIRLMPHALMLGNNNTYVD